MSQVFINRPGLRLVSRVLAAVVGGYLLSSAWIVMCGALWPSTAQAVMVGVQTRFVVYTLAVIWAFSLVYLSRVWLGLLSLAAAMGAAGALFKLGVN